MTQTEFIRSLASQTGMTQDAAKNVLALIGQMVEGTMRSGESVRLPALGTFTPVFAKERKGTSPKTGKPWKKPAHTRIKYTAAFEVE